MRPLLLDLFCGAGGCSRGYYDAGFDVVGVDIKPMKHYPYRFLQGDELRLLEMIATEGEWVLGERLLEWVRHDAADPG